MKRFRIAAAMFVFVIALLLAVPLTEFGTRMIFSFALPMQPAKVEFTSGSLAGDMHFANIELHTPEGMNISLHSSTINIDWSCSGFSRICIETLAADQLDIQLPTSDSSELIDKKAIRFPIAIIANNISVESSQVNFSGGEIHSAFNLADMQIKGSRLAIAHSEFSQFEMTLLASDAPESNKTEPRTLPELYLPFELDLAHLEVEKPKFDLQQAIALQRISTAFHWKGNLIGIKNFQANHVDYGEVLLQAAVTTKGNWPLDAQLQLVSSEQYAVPVLQNNPVLISLSGDVARTEIEATLLENVPTRLTGWVQPLTPEIPFFADIEIDAQGLNLQQLSQQINVPKNIPELANWHADAPVSLHIEGDIAQQTLNVKGAFRYQDQRTIALQSEVSVRDGNINVKTLQLDDVAQQQHLRLSGDIQLGETIVGEATVSSSNFSIEGFHTNVTGGLTGKVNSAFAFNSASSNWQVALNDIDIQGQMNKQPLTVKGDVQFNNQTRVAVGKVNANWGDSKVNFSPQSQGNGYQADIEVVRLQEFFPSLKGKLTAKVAFDSAFKQVTINGEAQALSWGEYGIQRLTWQGTTRTDDWLAVNATVDTESLSFGDRGQAAVRLKIESSAHNAAISLVLGGDLQGEVNWSGERLNNQWRGQLATSAIASEVGVWSLENPVDTNFDIDASLLTMANHCWQFAETAACLSDVSIGTTGNLAVILNGQLAGFNNLMPESVAISGAIDGEVFLRWHEKKPTEFSARIEADHVTFTHGLGWGESAESHWDSFLLQAEPFTGASDKGGLKLLAEMWRDGAQVVDIDAQLQLGREIAVDGTATLQQLKLLTFQPFIPSLSRLEGFINGDIKIGGAMTAPSLQGELDWQKGAIGLHANPNQMDNIAAKIQFDGAHAVINGTGRLGAGSVNFGGDIKLLSNANGKLKPEITANLQGENNSIAVVPEGELLVSPNLAIQLNAKGYHLGGELVVHQGLVKQLQLASGGVEFSDDIVEVDAWGEPVSESDSFQSSMDLTLTVKPKLRYIGSGIDATLGGQLQLLQQPGQALQLYGTLNVVGGELRAYSRGLSLKRGTLAFSGNPENPSISVRAERDLAAQGIRVGVSVEGTIEQPSLSLFSNPPMSETEMLSYLVRGRGLDSGAGYDGTAMALSLGTGVLNESGVLAPVEKLSGISEINFGAEGSEDDTVATVSGYVGDRLYLSYGVGIYQPIQELKARLYINSRLWLEIARSLENSVDIFYRFDID